MPHSEICGSTAICAYPQLIAACHVLLRLPVPRHSPCALFSLTVVLLLKILSANVRFSEFVVSHLILLSFVFAVALFSFQGACPVSLQFSESRGQVPSSAFSYHPLASSASRFLLPTSSFRYPLPIFCSFLLPGLFPVLPSYSRIIKPLSQLLSQLILFHIPGQFKKPVYKLQCAVCKYPLSLPFILTFILPFDLSPLILTCSRKRC